MGYQIKKDLSAKVIERKLDVSTLHKLPDEEIIAQLIQVKGIGRWTTEMFLIFYLGRLDILPVTESHAENIFSYRASKTSRDGIYR